MKHSCQTQIVMVRGKYACNIGLSPSLDGQFAMLDDMFFRNHSYFLKCLVIQCTNYNSSFRFFSIVVSNICEDESDEENDDNEDMVPMDITDAIEPVRVSVNHTIQHNLHTVASNLSSEPSNFPILGHPTMSSNISYQPKCASSTVSSAQRYRQWQILGGGFGENYDILPPEEEDELDEESEKELEEAKNFEIDLSSFLEQIISVHVRRHLNKGK